MAHRPDEHELATSSYKAFRAASNAHEKAVEFLLATNGEDVERVVLVMGAIASACDAMKSCALSYASTLSEVDAMMRESEGG